MQKIWQAHKITGLAVLLLLVFILTILIACNKDEYLIPEMVMVKAGNFQMGDEVGDLWNGCRPVHTVTLTYDFWVGKYPITFAEYDDSCQSTERDQAYDHLWGREERPVIYVIPGLP